jgi:hypothetical protein
VEAAAAALNVPLAHMTRSKPRARESRFGIANAINSGFLLARGRYITVLQVIAAATTTSVSVISTLFVCLIFVQDYIFLPPAFVATTIDFFEKHGDSLLSCERALCSSCIPSFYKHCSLPPFSQIWGASIYFCRE